MSDSTSTAARSDEQCTTFVIDTNVLLSHPNAIHQFAEHEVVIPLAVIEELEAKRTHALLGYQAREALRQIDAIGDDNTDLSKDVVINDLGGTLRVEMNHIDDSALPPSFKIRDNDGRILAVAANFKKEGADVVVVSKDLPMRLKAKALGLTAAPYRNEMVIVDKHYTGMDEAEVGTALIDDLHQEREIPFADLEHRHVPQHGGADVIEALEALPSHTGVNLIGPTSQALALVTPGKSLRLVRDREAFGVNGRSAEQRIALEHLLDPEIGVVSLGGSAGTGKTFLALAAGLEQVMEAKTYSKVTVFRNLHAVGGQELGYLPGTAEEKMGPWGAAVFDALEAMVPKDVVDEVLDRDMLEVLPLTHIRGRTLHDAFVIVDEAQNLDKSVLLTAMSRLGDKSKVVLSWDVAQRDNLRVGRFDGIAAIVERLKDERLFAHTTFTKTERGPVAEMVTRMLDDLIA